MVPVVVTRFLWSVLVVMAVVVILAVLLLVEAVWLYTGGGVSL